MNAAVAPQDIPERDDNGVRMRMPSDFRPEVASEVKVYMLSPEELAKYRGEGKTMSGRPRVDVDALHVRFAAGEGMDWKDAGRVAAEMGCATNTICYHRAKWDSAQEEAQAVTEPEPTPAAEETEPPTPGTPDLGDIHEGRIVHVSDRYALVSLPACGVVGKLGNREIRPGPVPTDLRHILKIGDMVNARVVGRWNGASGKDKWDLSIRQAPPHPEGPIIPEEEPVTIASASLCATCVKHDVCPLMDYYGDPQELPAESKPGRLAHVRVVFGARPVAECSAYVTEGRVSA